MQTDAAMGLTNSNNSDNDTQKIKATPTEGQQISAKNQHDETTSDKKDSSSEVKSSVAQGTGETGGGSKIDNPEKNHAETVPVPTDNNNVGKAENINHEHEQASVGNIS